MQILKTFQVDENGYYGDYGGAFIPELLHANIDELALNYQTIIDSSEFRQEYIDLLKDYVGRPTPLYYAPRLSEKYQTHIYLKREDLNHTGAHKINNTVGQILIAKKLGKKTNNSRDRSGATRGCYCYGLCPNEYALCGVYGRKRYRTPSSKCR
jgi:tryptophan synthase beta chain